MIVAMFGIFLLGPLTLIAFPFVKLFVDFILWFISKFCKEGAFADD